MARVGIGELGEARAVDPVVHVAAIVRAVGHGEEENIPDMGDRQRNANSIDTPSPGSKSLPKPAIAKTPTTSMTKPLRGVHRSETRQRVHEDRLDPRRVDRNTD